MAHRDACKAGHRYVAGSYSWRTNGTRRCRICERMSRKANRARQQLRAEAVQTTQLTGQEPAR